MSNPPVNPATEPIPPATRKRRWPWVIVSVVVVLAVAYGIYRYAMWRRVETRLDAIRAAGLPVTLAELDRWYETPPADENAYPLLARAFASLVPYDRKTHSKLYLVGTNSVARSEPIPEEMRKTVLEYLRAHEDALKCLHAAAERKRCRYPVALTQGWNALVPDLSRVRESARALALEAMYYAEINDPQRATRAVLDGLAVSRSLENEPLLISQLVLLAAQGISLFALEQVATRCPLPKENLAQLEAALADAEANLQVIRGYVGERCFVVDGVLNFPVAMTRAGNVLSPLDRFQYAWLKSTGMRDRALARYLDGMDRFFQANELAWPRRLKAVENVVPSDEDLNEREGELAATVRALVPGMDNNVLFFVVNGLFYLPGPITKQAAHTARLRCARTALAVEQYRLKVAELPPSLSALVPEYLSAVPLDPFDGAPLRFKKLANGYVVYSIGQNGKDDGGTEKVPPPQGKRALSRFTPNGDVQQSADTDITFTVEK